MADAPARRDRIVRVAIDDGGDRRLHPDIERERAVAVHDLVAGNRFRPAGDEDGPYLLRLAIEDGRLLFDIRGEDGRGRARVQVPMSPFRRIVKDYFAVCDSYCEAVRAGPRARIEAIDMGRRSLHDEGSERLRELVAGRIELDFDTARRLFTLVCVLHMRRPGR